MENRTKEWHACLFKLRPLMANLPMILLNLEKIVDVLL